METKSDSIEFELPTNEVVEQQMYSLNANFSERILYYMVNPKYFVYQLWLTIKTFTWRL